MIYTLPFIAAIIGWVTNYLAIKMLFHPKKEVKVLFIRIQGIFPKRKEKLAEKLGKVVSEELFSIEDVKQSLTREENVGKITEGRKDRSFSSGKIKRDDADDRYVYW